MNAPINILSILASNHLASVAEVRSELLNAMECAITDDRAKVPSFVARDDELLRVNISANQALLESLEHLSAISKLRDLLTGDSGLPDAERIQALRQAMKHGYANLYAEDVYRASMQVAA